MKIIFGTITEKGQVIPQAQLYVESLTTLIFKRQKIEVNSPYECWCRG